MLLTLPRKSTQWRLPAQTHPKTKSAFQAHISAKLRRQNLKHPGSCLQARYMGIAVVDGPGGSLEVGFAAHDGTCSTDFAVFSLQRLAEDSGVPVVSSRTDLRAFNSASLQQQRTVLTDFIMEKLCSYQTENMYKYVGIGLTKQASEMSPQIMSRLWLELDAMPFVFSPTLDDSKTGNCSDMTVDEQADSMARKATTYFGPNQQPHLSVGYRNEVGVDCAGAAHITCAADYQSTVGKDTWNSVMGYAGSLHRRQTKIAFLNSTPLGGDNATMKHALIRFLRLIHVDAKWYVPKPKPEVFRVTRDNREILCGEVKSNARLHQDSMNILEEWCKQNAEQFWLSEDGPLAPRSCGGADVVIVEDIQMSGLVKIAKDRDPTRPVVFCCQIPISAHLADQGGTSTSEVWNWMWDDIKGCDIFLSHPIRDCVPANITPKKVGYMSATADWLDGLNKGLPEWDSKFYIQNFRAECLDTQAHRFEYPNRPYVLQIIGSDSPTNLLDWLVPYAEFRRELMKDMHILDIPQLLVLNHSPLNNYDKTSICHRLQTNFMDIQDDVIFVHSGIADQTRNALMSAARVVLHISTQQDFGVRISEALHKGVPTVATRMKGMINRIEHGKSGFLVEGGDHKAVARYLHHLFTDHKAYDNMARHAATHVSDDLSTVGNALAWLYLADALLQEDGIEPSHMWINDMARKASGPPE